MNEIYLRKEKGKYYFQGQVYSKNKWYRKMANYLNFIDNNTVTLRRYTDEIRTEYIKTFILRNIRKTTFLMLIFPCVLFLVLSLSILWVAFIYQDKANFADKACLNIFIFSVYIASMLFLIGVILLVKIFFYQEKVIMTGSDKRVRMRHITKEQYLSIMNLFKKS